jgi:hypothetical protein
MRFKCTAAALLVFCSCLSLYSQVTIKPNGIANGDIADDVTSNEIEFEQDGFKAEIDLLITGSLGFGTGVSANDMQIDVNGNVGIGTNTPQGALDVDGSIYSNGNLIIDPSFLNGLYFEDENGIYGHLLGNTGEIALGTDLASGTLDPTIALTRGNLHFLRLYTDGRTGVNTNGGDPGTTFEVEHENGAGTNGLGVTRSGDADKAWHMYVFASGNLGFVEDNNSLEVERTLEEDGDWPRGSDRSLKSDIRTMDQELISGLYQLRATTYQYRTQRDNELQFGFIAQEVAEVFPDLVSRLNEAGEPERLGLSYEELIPITVAALQEQQKAIEGKDVRIAGLENQMNDLQNRLAQLEALVTGQSEEEAVTLNGDAGPTLDQNIPNPFRGITRIGYFLPQGTQQANLLVHDSRGREIKRIRLQEAGNGQLELQTRNLTAGRYSYSLYVDGTLIDTRQMVVEQ